MDIRDTTNTIHKNLRFNEIFKNLVRPTCGNYNHKGEKVAQRTQ
jgi:hypothetical protein